jgi:Carboxypeptidase regulatory-like domain
MKFCTIVLLATLAAACGSSPSAPSSTTPPPQQQQTFTLRGQVTSTAGGPVNGARVAVSDGPNAGKSTTSDGAGNYAIASLMPSGFTVNITATYFFATAKPVTLSGGDQTLNVQLDPVPLFSRGGSGNTVFDMPTSVSRIRVIADFGGYCQNFVVFIGGRLIANEILGSCSVATTGRHYDAIALTTGGVTEIKDSSGVAWSFTEVR